MSEPTSRPVTELLAAVGRGEGAAQERLWRAIYHELHGLAHRAMDNEAPGRTLQTTALVHEAYLRLFAGEDVSYANRRHFFAAAAKIMRQILIDDARRRGRLKRGGSGRRVPIDAVTASFDEDPAKLMAVDEALKKLAERNPQTAAVVEMRFFAGMREHEIAEALDVTRRTVQKEWNSARAWLHRELGE